MLPSFMSSVNFISFILFGYISCNDKVLIPKDLNVVVLHKGRHNIGLH